MLLALLKTNYKSIAIALGVVGLCWLLHTLDTYRREERHRQALIELQIKLEQACEKDKKITEDNNNALRKEYDAINAKLAAKRMQPARCVMPVTKQANATAGGGEHAGQNGISTQFLYEYAAECERYRQERITLEKFIDDVWQSKH